ncbi:MAG: GNAT family N-acetyltransferase [Pseudomonadota bacterium]
MTQMLATDPLKNASTGPQQAEAFMGFYASDRAHFFIGHLTREDARRRFTLDLGHWMLRSFGMFSARDRASNGFYGLIGYWFPEGRQEYQLGWFMTKPAEVPGIVFEATIEVRNDPDRRFIWKTLIGYFHSKNIRSRAMAERQGGPVDQSAVEPRPSMLAYRLPGPEAI